MDDPTIQNRAHLIARLAYIRALASVQADQLEKSLLKIVDLSGKLGLDAYTIKPIREMASMIALIKDLKSEVE